MPLFTWMPPISMYVVIPFQKRHCISWSTSILLGSYPIQYSLTGTQQRQTGNNLMNWKWYINVNYQKKPIKYWTILLIRTKINTHWYKVDLGTVTVYSDVFYFQKPFDVASIIHYEFYQKIKQTIEMADQVHKWRTTGTIYMYPIYRI